MQNGLNQNFQNLIFTKIIIVWENSGYRTMNTEACKGLFFELEKAISTQLLVVFRLHGKIWGAVVVVVWARWRDLSNSLPHKDMQPTVNPALIIQTHQITIIEYRTLLDYTAYLIDLWVTKKAFYLCNAWYFLCQHVRKIPMPNGTPSICLQTKSLLIYRFNLH